MHVHVNAWLASLTLLHHKTYASMHGHMNACSWYQERNRKETLIYHVKEKKKKAETQNHKKGQNRGMLCERKEETKTENSN